MPKLSRSKSGFVASSPSAPQAVWVVAMGAEQPELAEQMPAVPARAEMALSIPSNERFLKLRAEAKQNGTLKDLQKLVAAWLAVGEKCNLVFEEMTRLAIYRLEVERDLGRHLAQSVRPGRPRKLCPKDTISPNGLPDDISPKMSVLYQRLAAVPDDTFRDYLAHALGRHVVPSSRGARLFAAAAGRKATRPKQKKRARSVAASVAIPAEVLECIARIMTPDLIVGDANLPSKKSIVADSKGAIGQLRGDVLVAQCPDPARWLSAIDRARRETRVSRAIVVLPAPTLPEWIASLEHGDWLLCCLRGVRNSEGNGIMLAHIGERSSVFRLAFHPLGVVLRAATTD